MNGLSKYKKTSVDKQKTKNTSVLLTLDQIEWVRKNRINLSLLVREWIESLRKNGGEDEN